MNCKPLIPCAGKIDIKNKGEIKMLLGKINSLPSKKH